MSGEGAESESEIRHVRSVGWVGLAVVAVLGLVLVLYCCTRGPNKKSQSTPKETEREAETKEPENADDKDTASENKNPPAKDSGEAHLFGY